MLMFISLSVYANDIYVNQSGATLDLDITQDGQNNTVGSSGTASSVIGATTNLAITHFKISAAMLCPEIAGTPAGPKEKKKLIYFI